MGLFDKITNFFQSDDVLLSNMELGSNVDNTQDTDFNLLSNPHLI